MTASETDAGEAAAAPTCYRHRDRETWVRCVRCDRPICPQCMHEASVGFQCPDDVAAGNRTVRAPRTALGGRLSQDERRTTTTLVAVLVAVHVLRVVDPGIVGAYGLWPFGLAWEGSWWRLVTAGFLHVNVLHLLLNCLALLSGGPLLERLLGRARLLSVLGVSLLGGTVGSLLLGSPDGLSVGASGAVYGLFGALLVVGRRVGGDLRPLLALLGVNLVLSVVVPSIDLWAHLGGLLAGLVLGAAYSWAPVAWRRAVAVAAPSVLVLLLLGVAVARVLALRQGVGRG